MTKRKTFTYAVAFASAATLSFAGCTGGNEDPTAAPKSTSSASSSGSPSASISSSSSTSPTASVSPTASASAPIEIPANVKANTEDGAIAFVRFWFEQVNAAFTRPDAAVIPYLSAPACKSCASLAESPTEFALKGQKAQPAPFMPLTKVQSVGKDPEGQYRVSFTLAQNNVNVVDASGKVVDTQEGGSAQRVALVSRKGEQWVMQGLASPQS